MDNCLKEKPEISTRAVHQDQLDKNIQLDGDSKISESNSEATSIKEQTVYFDIRFKAYLPSVNEMIQIVINLEIQVDDIPGHPLITRAFYYCARMISEQYGTDFTNEHYEKLHKVYSIWICPNPANKRKNSISKYHTIKEDVLGSSDTTKESYDLMEVVIINLGEADVTTNVEILDLLNVLFSPTTLPNEKKKILSEDFNIAMTEEFESEVQNMCNLSEGLVKKGEDKLAQLIVKLIEDNRQEDIIKVSTDKDLRNEMYKVYGII